MMMKNSIRLFVFLGIFLQFTVLNAQDFNASKDVSANLKALHSGKSGIYVRLGGRDDTASSIYRSHPLLDAVILGCSWRQVEPDRGNYSFNSLIEDINQWGKAGKGVVVNVMLYGQAVDDALTPSWLYNQADVREISFQGGGTAKGRKIRVPAVWDEKFIDQYIEPMVKAMAKALDGNPHVWYIIPSFGHIGALTAQPSKDGARALLDAGWTAEKWSNYSRRIIKIYQDNFKKTPLFLKSSGMFIRDRKQNYYERNAAELFTEFGKKGVTVLHFGLESDKGKMMDVYNKIAGVIPAARAGITRMGLGDDWPLWVPESRRSHGPTLNHDEQHLRKSIEYAFGGTDGIPEIPTTILFCQDPETKASYPSGANYRPEVYEMMKNARARLKKNDAEIFGAR